MFPQLRNMKDWVDFGLCRQLQFVGHNTHLGYDGEGTKKLGCQLLRGSCSHSLLSIGLQLNINQISNFHYPVHPVLVCLLFHPFLGPL